MRPIAATRACSGQLKAGSSLAEWVTVAEFERIINAGDRLVSIHKARTKARHTGIEIDTPLVYVWSLRNGKVVQIRAFVGVDEALEAAGLQE